MSYDAIYIKHNSYCSLLKLNTGLKLLTAQAQHRSHTAHCPTQDSHYAIHLTQISYHGTHTSRIVVTSNCARAIDFQRYGLGQSILYKNKRDVTLCGFWDSNKYHAEPGMGEQENTLFIHHSFTSFHILD